MVAGTCLSSKLSVIIKHTFLVFEPELQELS